MSYKKLFWGVLLIVIGVLFILKNMGLIYFSWSVIIDLWPLLLILWGISIIPVHALIRLGLSVVAVIITFLLIDTTDFKGRHHRWTDDLEFRFDKKHDRNHDEYDRWDKEKDNTYDWSESQELTANYEGVEYAFLDFDAGAGSFSIDGTTDDYLAVFKKQGNVGRYYMTTRTDDDSQFIDFKLKEKNIEWSEENHNTVQAQLNDNPVWEFDFDIGAAEVDFDLSWFKVKKIELDGGAAEITIRLGDEYENTDININAGASDVTLDIPAHSGARVRVSSFLSGRALNGFTKEGDYYVTDNYENSRNKIDIRFQAAVSNLTVDRY